MQDHERRSRAVALMRQAIAVLDDDRDGYILMRLQHAIDEAMLQSSGEVRTDDGIPRE